jgi:hypothetical protein
MTAPFRTSPDAARGFLDAAIATFRSQQALAEKAIAQIPEDKLHLVIDSNVNPIAVIMKHVGGNLLSRWTDFLTADGEKPWRNRDDEFIDTLGDRAELLAAWNSGWCKLYESLSALADVDLEKTVVIRGEPHSVPLAIQRSLAHCAYHVGQIVMTARILAGENWTVLTIPRGGSGEFNKRNWGRLGEAAPGPDPRTV